MHHKPPRRATWFLAAGGKKSGRGERTCRHGRQRRLIPGGKVTRGMDFRSGTLRRRLTASVTQKTKREEKNRREAVPGAARSRRTAGSTGKSYVIRIAFSVGDRMLVRVHVYYVHACVCVWIYVCAYTYADQRVRCRVREFIIIIATSRGQDVN